LQERQIMPETPPKASNTSKPDISMSFLDHLEELRWRLVKGLIAIGVGVVVAYIFRDFFINTVLLGPVRADFFIYKYLGLDAIDITLQSRRLPGQFFTMWGMLFIIGFIIASPMFVYQLWSFVEPAFETTTNKKTFFTAMFITLFFIAGVSFGYLILVPFALQFFSQFQISELIRNDFDINAYFSSVATWVLSCGIIFQIPVVSYSLSSIGLLTPEFMRKYRRHAIVFCLVLAALLTPPDPVSQVLIALPLTFLYELSIWVSKISIKRRERKLKEAFGETEEEA